MPDRTATTELTDNELGRILRTGTVIGFPLVFVASTVMTLHVGLANAITIAVLPTLFSGSFVGGLILLLRALRKEERDATMTLRPFEQLPKDLAADPPLPVKAASGTTTRIAATGRNAFSTGSLRARPSRAARIA